MLDLNLFRKEPDAWLFTGVKPGERRQFASVDNSVSQTWPTDNGFTWTIEPLYLSRMPIPEGWQLVPIKPTEEMIDCGAQGMASFQEDSVWPDSWDATQVKGMRHDAKKAYRYMLSAAPKPEELK
jgi:hypothetical protein